MLTRSAYSIQRMSLSVVILLATMAVGGCGSAASRGDYGTYTVSGIVVSYPGALTRTVTLADLTPVGANVRIQIAEQGRYSSTSSSYYHTHTLPVTDSNGRFTIQVDEAFVPPVEGTEKYPVAEILVPDRCSTTAWADQENGVVSGGTTDTAAFTHIADQQLVAAGKLAGGHYGTDVVVVVTDNADACQDPTANETY